jgi:hypothetical protein
MKDETRGAIEWWVARILKWAGLATAALFPLWLLAVYMGMNGWPF